MAVTMDVSKEEDIERAVRAVVQKFGRLGEESEEDFPPAVIADC